MSDQLHVSAEEFWNALRTRKPVPRPSSAPELPPASLPLWIAQTLEREVGLSRDQIEEVDVDRVRELIDDARSRPKRRR